VQGHESRAAISVVLRQDFSKELSFDWIWEPF
jgi:hypothetical protein